MSFNPGDVVKTGLGSTRIRCVVVDDHALLRQGVRRLLQDEADFEVVDEAGNGTDALKMVLQHRPDLILMDIGMPGPSSFETARHIQKACPDTKVVFLTMHEDDQLFLDEAESHMRNEQEENLRKMNRLVPPVRVFGAASVLLILVIGGMWLYQGLSAGGLQ